MSAQQFSLRWNNHTSNLVQVFMDHYERESMVDVTLSCQGKFVKAHKMVLGACSPYFEDLFAAHQTSNQPLIIIMNGFEFDDIRALVEFMYKGEVRVSEEDMERILAAAESLQIRGLSNVRNKREAEEGDSTPEKASRKVGGSAVPPHKRRKRMRKSKEKEPTVNGSQVNNKGNHDEQVDQSAQSSSDEEDCKSDDLPMDIKVDPPMLRDIDAPCRSDWDAPKEIELSNGYLIDDKGSQVLLEPKEKIPRPPNAFMIFANEWRRKLANQFSKDSNKEISVRLGVMWKSLPAESKERYYVAAKQANEDHKKKHPDYHYNPKEARLRKLWKTQTQQMNQMLAGSVTH